MERGALCKKKKLHARREEENQREEGPHIISYHRCGACGMHEFDIETICFHIDHLKCRVILVGNNLGHVATIPNHNQKQLISVTLVIAMTR